MAIVNFVPTLWSAVILRDLQKRFVYAGVCNRNYEGEISQVGDRVRISTANAVSVRTYTKGTAITYDDIDGTYQDFIVDQSKYWALKIEDIDRLQMKPDLMAESVTLAGVAISDVVDQYVAGILAASAGVTTDLGTSATPLEIESTDVVGFLSLVARRLDEAKVSRAGRWIVVPPWFAQKITLSKIVAETSNSEVLSSGFVGHYVGFDIFMSPNVPNTTSAKWKIMAGTSEGMTYADQIVETEAIRLETNFADALRGLYVYAGKVIQPNALALAYCNEAAEA
ncbi:MAG: hypothetical protein A2001_19285 [Treponema sp. GWC1_61_84]|nr:MAG: hypothetical protein A2001_19285 [Treponema sp. GWC1_61_84]